MITLALIGLVGGLITGISPCILPVLPVIFLSGGAQSARGTTDAPQASRWRPYLVIAGLVAWDEAYRDAGLTVIGIHSPEYAFEKEPRNVEAGIRSFGIEYPVALDNSLATWTNYRNRYTTKQVNFAGEEPYRRATTAFEFPSELPADAFALDGDWGLDTQSITPGSDDALVRLAYTGREVRLVLGGAGTVTVGDGSGPPREIEIAGVPRSHRLLQTDAPASAVLTVTVSPGVDAYSFTFG